MQQIHRIAGHAQEITLRVHRPPVGAGLALPVLLYLHGGGFVNDACPQEAGAMRHLADTVPAVVVEVDYSLAPAHPFPAALYDGVAALKWVRAKAGGLGADAHRLGLVGVDAGGHIATSLTLCSRDKGETDIKAMALTAPLLDPSMTRLGDVPATVAGADALTRYSHCYQAYLPDLSSRLHPYATPLDCRRLAGLPPTLMLTAGDDILRQEAQTFADKLAGAGVAVRTVHIPSASHGDLATRPGALEALSAFFAHRLAA